MKIKTKSKGMAYALWLFLGLFGGHRFYLGDISKGFLQLITVGGFGVWWFLDLFSLSGKVDRYNLLYSRNPYTNQNNIVVNVVNNDSK